MSAVEDRLSALGLEVPPLVPPVAAYVPAVRCGDLVWVSGQIPVVAGEVLATGKVGSGSGSGSDAGSGSGADIDPDRAAELARVCALNALAAVKAEIGDLDNVERIVKVIGFVASAPDFFGQPAVVNGASELLVAAFGDAGRHARSAVGVAVLPLDVPVEIELVASVRG